MGKYVVGPLRDGVLQYRLRFGMAVRAGVQEFTSDFRGFLSVTEAPGAATTVRRTPPPSAATTSGTATM